MDNEELTTNLIEQYGIGGCLYDETQAWVREETQDWEEKKREEKYIMGGKMITLPQQEESIFHGTIDDTLGTFRNCYLWNSTLAQHNLANNLAHAKQYV